MIEVDETDAAGNVLADAHDTVRLSLEGGATGLGGETTAVAINGRASFPELVISRRVPAAVLRATAGEIASSSSPIAVSLDGARLRFLAVPDTMTAGSPSLQAMIVGIADSTNNLVLRFLAESIDVAVAFNGAVMHAPLVAGKATLANLVVSAAGSYPLSVTAATLSPISATVSVLPPALQWTATPQPVIGGHRFTTLAAFSMGRTICGLDTAGSAWCWGSGNPLPKQVPGAQTFVDIAEGDRHFCALTGSGEVWCWGDNSVAQLGTFAGAASPSPVLAFSGTGFTRLAAGQSFTCGLTAQGLASCWGTDYNGALGADTISTSPGLTPVQGHLVFTSLFAGFEATCGTTAPGPLYCWGSNPGSYPEQSYRWDEDRKPLMLPDSIDVRAVAIGGEHMCELSITGAAYCRGYNDNGQLGHAVNMVTASPAPVAGGLQFAAITASGAHTCAITASGSAYCWGANGTGQLGDSTRNSASTPVLVSGNHHFNSIIAFGPYSSPYQPAEGTTCALDDGGVAYCWGGNSVGQLGIGR